MGSPSKQIEGILASILMFEIHFKDVLMGIPKSGLLSVTMAVIHIAGQHNLAV